MNCGKSTAIMQVGYNYYERGLNAMIMKPMIDTKGDDKVVSRLGIDKKVDFLVPEDGNVFEMVKTYIDNHKI